MSEESHSEISVQEKSARSISSRVDQLRP